jgi:hypothetical protein
MAKAIKKSNAIGTNIVQEKDLMAGCSQTQGSFTAETRHSSIRMYCLSPSRIWLILNALWLNFKTCRALIRMTNKGVRSILLMYLVHVPAWCRAGGNRYVHMG